MDALRARMEKSIDALRHELAAIRTGRANASLLDHVTVEYYGAQVPISQVASITVPEARMLVISPWEKHMLPEIEKAILASDVGITPSSDGSVIRLVLPELTGERRRELVRKVHQVGETARIAVRNIRRDANDAVRKDESLSQDEAKRRQEQIQKETDRFIAEIDRMLKAKEQEILTI
ncbi:MAG: ribosome recycling factor [Zetaproteobacteria bacterium]|nr:MAG: ribosome recycling factor [Zetaproteobacteria bacterium]